MSLSQSQYLLTVHHGQLRRCGSCVERIEPKKVGCCTLDKGTLLEAKLPHHLDRMILNTPGEPWQHNQLHVTSAEEDSERFSSGWDDTPGYYIIC